MTRFVEDPTDTTGRTVSQIEAMLAVSRAVAGGGPLSEVLDEIALQAAGAAGADSASILLLRGSRRFSLAGRHGLSRGYGERLARAPRPIEPGVGPSGLAVAHGQAIVIADTETDRRIAPWAWLARAEGYRAMISIPLAGDRAPIGALNVYRRRRGAWPERDVELLDFFGRHAASAISTVQLIDGQARRLDALQRLVRGLRAQAHEHANRLHAIGGLLALGATEEATGFLAQLNSAYHVSYGSITERIGPATVAGLVLAETTIARQRGVELVLLEDSRLECLPPTLDEAEAITILGNLLDNAVDAVAGQPKNRRRVELAISESPDELIFLVCDQGREPGRAKLASRVPPGLTTKPGHAGLGLTLVAEAVASAFGRLTFDADPDGTRVEVRIPRA